MRKLFLHGVAFSAVLGPGRVAGQTPPTAASAPQAPSTDWQRAAGWTGIGAGVLAAGVGVYFHVQASDTRTRGDALGPGRPDEASALQADLDGQVTSVVLSYGVGAALASAGIVLLALTPNPSITGGPTSTGTTWGFTF